MVCRHARLPAFNGIELSTSFMICACSRFLYLRCPLLILP